MASTLMNPTREELARPFFDEFVIGDPFGALTSIRKSIDSMLDATLRSRVFEDQTLPAMDLYFKEGKYIVELALPGLDKKDVNIEVEGNGLTISGTYGKEIQTEEKRYHYRELRRGSFSRSVTFPENLDPAKIVATMEAGLLKIEIPSFRPAEPKKVAIK
jgi:HSP20 family protein